MAHDYSFAEDGEGSIGIIEITDVREWLTSTPSPGTAKGA